MVFDLPSASSSQEKFIRKYTRHASNPGYHESSQEINIKYKISERLFSLDIIVDFVKEKQRRNIIISLLVT